MMLTQDTGKTRDTGSDAQHRLRAGELAAYVGIGIFFGIVLIKSEVVSWYRIQEMFRFQSFFMYGVLGSAVATATLVFWLARKLDAKAINGKPLQVPAKDWGDGARHRYWIGGTLFGIGWGLAGTCPGPVYALMGYGAGGAVAVFLAALVGTRTYAALHHKLPH